MSVLVIYRCYDNLEEEPCFLVKDNKEAKNFMDRSPLPPVGFTNRPGYYFFEDYNGIMAFP